MAFAGFEIHLSIHMYVYVIVPGERPFESHIHAFLADIFQHIIICALPRGFFDLRVFSRKIFTALFGR